MPLLEILALAFGLAMDATAVSGARGLAAAHVRVRDALLVAALFGGAQGIMPAIGWAGGELVARYVAGWSHLLVFLVLSAIGAKMIHEARAPAGEADAPRGAAFDVRVLLALAVATSIDALAAGVTLAVHEVHVALACSIIGVVTFTLSFVGVYAGRRFGARLGRRLDAVGGVTLLALGLRSLVEHITTR